MAATAFMLRGAVGCSWGGRFGGGVGESTASSSGEAPWMSAFSSVPSSSSSVPAFMAKAAGGMVTNLGDRVGV